jgi:hypothetical protein
MNVNKLKVNNIKGMFTTLGEIHKNMSSSELKKDYSRFLFFMQSNRADLKKIIEYTDKRIKLYSTDSHHIKGMHNKYIVAFWGKVKSIILDVYLSNKKLDRSS